MDTIDKHIVAIDLGTSKIALTVAKVEGNDVQIVYYRETPSAGIRYSSVFNVKNVTEALASAISQAEDELNIKITQAVVGMPKYPVRKVNANAEIDGRGEDTDITEEDIDALKSFAQDSYPLEDVEKEAIFGAVAQSFSDGENFQIIEQDIVGMTSDVLEGNFKIFIGKKSDLSKVDQVMNRCGVAAIHKFFTADTTAKAVLNSSEMENGVSSMRNIRKTSVGDYTILLSALQPPAGKNPKPFQASGFGKRIRAASPRRCRAHRW